MELLPRLQPRVEKMRQRLLTPIRRRARASTPDGLQRGIHLEHLADRDDALRSVGAHSSMSVDPTERVGVQAASMGQKQASVSTAMGC